MKVVDLNGRVYNWPPPGHQPAFNELRPRSELHLRARAILYELYPTQPILEEVPLPGTGLFADFYLPVRKVVIECQGEQHFKYVPHFHGNLLGFRQAQARDARKVDWCTINNIKVILLPYMESDDEWRTRISA